MTATAADIVAQARALGFALAGVCQAAASSHQQYIRDWLTRGHHGEMDYLARNLELRLDPARLLPGARSVICVADRYPGDSPPGQSPPRPTAQGRLARYAWGRDYHKVIKKRLHRLADQLGKHHPGHVFRATVDTAPMLEREHAYRAGLGWIGKHTLMIHPQQGSWLLLGTIVTTLPIEPLPDHIGPMPDHCGTCTRCIDACPTDCITPYALDAKRCISYLTLEHRSLIDPQLHSAMGQWIGGCDICQEVCPHNRPRPNDHPAYLDDYQPRPPAPGLDLLEVLGWSAKDRQEAFTGSSLKRIKLDMLKRNALIAAGNYLAEHDHPALRRRVAELADDPAEPDLVRHTAQQVLDRMQADG